MVCAALLVFGVAATTVAESMGEGVICSAGEKTVIMLDTYDGEIEIEVFPDVAPAAVAQLLRLVEGPIFSEEFTAAGPEQEPVGYFDGLSFDHARAGHEIATSIRPPGASMLIRMQMDAVALGLEDRRVESSSAAMELWQNEIIPYEGSIHGRKAPPGLLGEWMAEWKQTMRPDFLVGVSRKDVNEALGFVYESGLPSLPVRRGSVGLRRISKEWATPALIIHLVDRPSLDGQRMIIGKVISDIEVIDRISRRRLTPTKSERNRPLNPVRILDGHFQCRSAADADVPTQ